MRRSSPRPWRPNLPPLISFLLAFAVVGLAGSAFMFLLKGGTVAVLAEAERNAAAIEEPPLRLEPFWTAARFSVSRYDLGCRRHFRRFLRLGFMLILVYLASAAAYLVALLRGAEWFTHGQLGWTAIAGIGSTVLVVWVTLVNFFYLLIQMVVVVEDCSVRSAIRRRRASSSGRAETDLRGFRRGAAVSGRGHDCVGDCDDELGTHRVCPLAGLAVVPLQLLAWLFRGLVFQFLVSALSAPTSRSTGVTHGDRYNFRSAPAGNCTCHRWHHFRSAPAGNCTCHRCHLLISTSGGSVFQGRISRNEPRLHRLADGQPVSPAVRRISRGGADARSAAKKGRGSGRRGWAPRPPRRRHSCGRPAVRATPPRRSPAFPPAPVLRPRAW